MEALNTQLLQFFDKLLWISVQGSVLIILIVLLQIVLRRRLGIRWHYFLWGLLLIRLAMPWLPESKISIFNLVPKSIQQGRLIESFSQSRSTDGMGFYMHSRSVSAREATDESGTVSVRLARALPALWLIGTVLIAGYVCMRNISLWLTVKRERPITDQEILNLLEDCKMEMGVQTILGVVVSDKIKSPALFGFVRPRLLLPQGMLETYGLEELRYVFIHELAHLRQRDIYFGWLMALLQIAHWFNPLMWFAFGRMRADRELACDGLAISMMDADEPPRYGQTIVNVLENFSQVSYVPSVAGILEDKSQIERRIKMIADYKKTQRSRWAGAMLLLVVLACVVLTNAYIAKADFTFGTPTNLGNVVNNEWGAYGPCISADGLELYYSGYYASTNEYGQVDLWVVKRESIHDPWGNPENLGPNVNTGRPEHAPSITGDGLLLFFMRYDELFLTNRESHADPWEEAIRVGPPIDAPWAVDSPACVSPDGLSLFFHSTRSGGGDIYIATRETRDDEWSEPEKLGSQVNSSDYQEGWNLNISTDGLSLFFGSGYQGKPRPGGLGKCDIWVTTRKTTSDDWGVPLNLGSTVNGPQDEIGASISSDGSILYFASDRSGGFGTSDLWQVSILPIVDFNSDGIVDAVDVCMMLDFWHTDEPLYDIAPMPFGDGIVDVKDLVLLAEHLTVATDDPNEPDLP